MKKVLLLLVLILLTGCSASEEKMITFAEEKIKEDYGVEVNVISIEPDEKVGALIVVLMDELLNPDLYYLEFETVDEPKFIFSGSIRDNLEFDENFIEDKHEYLLSTNSDYKKNEEILIQNGFKDVKPIGYINEDKVTIDFRGIYLGEESNTEEVAKTLFEMADELIQEPHEIIVKFEYDPIKLDNRYITYSVSTTRYEENETKTLAVVLEEQFEFVKKHYLVENDIDPVLEQFNIHAISSLNQEMNQEWPERLITEHEIRLISFSGMTKEDILTAFEMFNEAGLDQSIVIIAIDGEGKSCKVRAVKEAVDLERCYSL